MKTKELMWAAALSVLTWSTPSSALIPVVGWGYSLGYSGDKLVGADVEGLWSIWFDPVAETLYSGRMTYHFDPKIFSIDSYGWVGQFAFDPSIPAPPATSDGRIPTYDENGDPWILQHANNGLDTNVIVDHTNGLITITWDWGVDGYIPVATGHFNIFGIRVRAPSNTVGFKFVPRGTGQFGLLGSADDVLANGNNALTYMACGGGYCGEEPLGDLVARVPEPASWAFMIFGFGLVGVAMRRRDGFAA